MSSELYYAVDRIEAGVATLVSDSGESVSVPKGDLPADIAEGSVLRVANVSGSAPDWRSATIDDAETARRRREAEKILRELRERDPGGDIEL